MFVHKLLFEEASEDKEKTAKRESAEGYEEFIEELKKLSEESPNPDNHVFVEPYMKILLEEVEPVVSKILYAG